MPALPSDELGEKGESRFRELCADARLICNKSDRDRTGWDFIVDFPFEAPSPESTLDKRPSPISCRVQVKTVLNGTRRIKLRLSSAERLAKEPCPTFICTLAVNEALQFTGLHLIHLADAQLARILKRLRKAHKDGNSAINKMHITFDLDGDGVAIPASGSSLRDFITKAVGSDATTYTERKKDQLRTIGFDHSRYIIKTTLKADSYDDLIDAFLGLKEVQYETLESFERRFGIELPLEKDANSKLQISPNPIERCLVKFRSNDIDKPVVMHADLFTPAIHVDSAEKFKIRIKNDLIEIIAHRTSAQITTIESVWSESRPLSSWITIFRLRRILASSNINIEIITSKGILRESSDELEHDKSAVDFYDHRLRQAENVAQLLEFAGIDPGAQKFSSFREIAGELTAFGHAARKEADVFRWKATGSVACPPETMLYVGFVCAFEMHFAFSLTMNIEWDNRTNGLAWRARSVSIKRVERIGNLHDDFDAFASQEKSLTTGAVHMIVRPAVYDDDDSNTSALPASTN